MVNIFLEARMHIPQDNPETGSVIYRAVTRKWVLEQSVDPGMTNKQRAPFSGYKHMQWLPYHPIWITGEIKGK